MNVTIIIPTYNEAQHIGTLIKKLKQFSSAPIIVANSPNTTDQTAHIAKESGGIILNCPKPGRAAQMNYAAKHAELSVLYFVHADTIPPKDFEENISKALTAGTDFGYFSYRFNSSKRMLRLNSRATRKDGIFSGGGDQTLFIKKQVFKNLGGFRDELMIMEDFDLVNRAKKAGYQHKLIQNDVSVSDRKYRNNSWLWVNLVNLCVFFSFFLGVPQQHLHSAYKRLLGG